MKLHFGEDNNGKKIFLGAGNAGYKKKGHKSFSVDGDKAKAKKIIDGKTFTIDKKKRTVTV